MQRKGSSVLLATILLLALAGTFYDSYAAKKPKGQEAKSWRSSMSELSVLLGRLVPDVISDKRFNDPARLRQIEADVARLAVLAHEIKAAPTDELTSDPSLRLISSVFSREATRASQELKSGNRSFARAQLKTLSGYCIACHTRQAESKIGKGISIDLAPFSAMEKGEFLTASRRFDEALDAFGKVISDAGARTERQVEWSRAVRYALAIAVRVKRDPDKARSLVEQVMSASNVPQFMKENARAWLVAIAEWKKEKPVPSTENEETLHQEALRLVSRARAAQEYPLDQSGDVDYLRATAVLHDQLSKYPDGKRSPASLLLVGVCYEVLRDLNVWTLHEMYYEACVRKAPHSDVGLSCYRKLEQSYYAGYAGSAGIFLPTDVKARLTELETLAKPLPKTSP